MTCSLYQIHLKRVFNIYYIHAHLLCPPHLLRVDGCLLLVTSSIAGWHSPPQMCYYNATKAALTSLGRDLRYIGRNHNIKVNVIAPGLISTRMTLDKQKPLPFSSWFAASPENLATIIRWNLFENNFVVTWPYHQFLAELAIASLPPRILDSVQRLIGGVWSVFSPAKDKPMT